MNKPHLVYRTSFCIKNYSDFTFGFDRIFNLLFCTLIWCCNEVRFLSSTLGRGSVRFGPKLGRSGSSL